MKKGNSLAAGLASDRPPGVDIEPEPRWPAFLALMTGACLYSVLPPRLSVGPYWLLMVLMAVLLVPIIASHRRRIYTLARRLTFVAITFLTVSLVGSLVLLIQGLPGHKDDPASLLRSAAVLWVTNILVFALWYWKLDAGGPLGRDLATGPIRSSFLFPQMVKQPPEPDWAPEFLDYLFLAFNTSTAFSPTDTAVLDPWAKMASMLQAIISLAVLAVLAARAINIL